MGFFSCTSPYLRPRTYLFGLPSLSMCCLTHLTGNFEEIPRS
jgi:hypothetical protein